MIATALYITDVATENPVLVIRFGPDARREDPTIVTDAELRGLGEEGRVLERAGYNANSEYVILVDLLTLEAQHDPYRWSNATLRAAHLELAEDRRWPRLHAGDRLDVRRRREQGIVDAWVSGE